MKKCAVYVQSRSYSEPGPCEMKKAIERVRLVEKTILACEVHRRFIAAGGKPKLNQETK